MSRFLLSHRLFQIKMDKSVHVFTPHVYSSIWLQLSPILLHHSNYPASPVHSQLPSGETTISCSLFHTSIKPSLFKDPPLQNHTSGLPLKTVPAVRIEPRRSWQKLHDRLRLFLRYMTHFHTRLRFFLCCMRKINIWLRFFLRWMTLNYLCFCLRAKTQSIGNRDRVESLDF